MYDFRIERVSKDNWKKAVQIDMKPEQKHLLASVTYCLARAFINPYQAPIEPFVIYANNEIVGFFWFTLVDDGSNCVLCGFRIDKKHQGLGYSKVALYEIVKLLRSEYKACNSIQLFVEIDNIPAKDLYRGFGFETVCIDSDNNLEHMLYKLNENSCISLISEECLNDE